jgi:methionyl-tRNA synthetase
MKNEHQSTAATDSSDQPKVASSSGITFDDFLKIEIRIGTILSVDIVEGADKLLSLMVDVGEPEPRQILSAIREYVTDEQELVGRQSPFVTNLPPRTIRGLDSNGMILAAGEAGFTFLSPDAPLPAGTLVR